MATSYPLGIDNFTNPSANDYEDVVSHSGQHSNANDAIEAIETTLGTTAGTAVIDNFSAGERAVAIAGTATLKNVDAILDEDDMASNSATALATQQSIKAYVDAGWYTLGETMTYASADDPTYTATVAGVDLTGVLSPGMRMRVEQSTGGTKYFIITKVAFSTDTTITLYGGTDYDLENEAISNPKFAVVKAPVGFPLEKSKWSVLVISTNREKKLSPSSNVWYNIGSTSIDIPIGAWDVSYKVAVRSDATSVGTKVVQTTLSTANNNESDATWTSYFGPSPLEDHRAHFFVSNPIEITTKDTYYLNTKINDGTNVTAIYNWNDSSTLVIRAVSAYL